MQQISKKVMSILCEQGVIKESDMDSHVYGMEIFLSSVIEVMSIVLISSFVGNFAETVIFFAVFIPLRIFAGGYHAATRLRCYLVSLAVYALFTVLIKTIPENAYMYITISEVIFTVIAVGLFSPVIHANKHLNSTEIRNFRKFSIEICMVQTITIISLTIILKSNVYLLSAAMGDMAVAAAMVVAVLKDKI